MRVEAFDFELPADRIAQHPIRPRDAARLLVVGESGWLDRRVRDLPDLLTPGDLLVFNDTRVLPTRLAGRRGEVAVEVTLHSRLEASIWRAFARPAKRLRLGDRIVFAPGFAANVSAKGEAGEVTLAFEQADRDLPGALHRHGQMPLPPYIKRGPGGAASDHADYQTIFARHDGAVAAPTASLHVTDTLLAALEARGIDRAFVTLHVGPGTFLPVRVEHTRDHVMHAEWYEVPPLTAERIRACRGRGGRVVAVGTTVLRTLETVARARGQVEGARGETSLFLTPGDRFLVVDRLLTNFHLPRSTLFMLVAAFSGLERIKAAYAHAIEAGYRFYSYGDACLLDRSDG